MRNTFLYLLLLGSLSAAAQLTASETKELIRAERRHFQAARNQRVSSVASSNYDVTYYRCYWTVNPAVRTITGTVMTRFRTTATATSITFDLHNQLTVDSVVYHGSNATFVRGTDNSLKINFAATIAAGALDSVRVHYRGTPPNTGYYVTTNHAGTPLLYTQSESYGASHWWPCKDVNADKADSVDLYITCPSQYISSSNGLPVEESVTAGMRTTRWKHRYPIAPYLVAVAATNYVISTDNATLPGRDLPLVLYAYPENSTAFQPILGTAKFCLQEFTPLISDYPFLNERYGQTQWNLGGGMEHQTNTFLGSTSQSLVAHELAHQWFGDKVTCRSWSDIWLNEGFASYMEFQYMLLTTPATRVPFLQSWTNTITALTNGSVYIPPADTVNEARIFDNRLTYKKGGYLGVMLRWKLGDSVFYRGLRRYLNDPTIAYGTVLTADLQRNLEAESGQSLTEFFNDWFYGQGFPNYSAQWTPVSGGSVQVTLSQTQSHPSVSFYEMPVPLQFKDATHDTTVIANHTQTGQLFTFNLGFTPDTMIIDPQLWILSKTKTVQRVLTSVPELLPPGQWAVYPNPARTSVTIRLPAGNWSGTTLRLFNAAGQKVLERPFPSGTQATIPVTGLPPGVYWLELSQRKKGASRLQLLIAAR
ncbi:MAG: T9SS type A sorting domain-containing protein [Chitinophagaceae bacterium]|nr:MAG: T9SS type A sorting domain-containing protein [Chitinophagaceae bacterium]